MEYLTPTESFETTMLHNENVINRNEINLVYNDLEIYKIKYLRLETNFDFIVRETNKFIGSCFKFLKVIFAGLIPIVKELNKKFAELITQAGEELKQRNKKKR
jgi:hypothetical protein